MAHCHAKLFMPLILSQNHKLPPVSLGFHVINQQKVLQNLSCLYITNLRKTLSTFY